MTPVSRTALKILMLLAMLGLPLAAIFTGGARLVPFLAMPLVVLGGPMLLELRGGADPGAEPDDDSDSDDGPGGNRRPDRGPTTPSGPRGELPLEFSAPVTWRLRGATPQRGSDPGHRRQPHRAPVRSPSRVPSRGR